jgi:hypothetical protein
MLLFPDFGTFFPQGQKKFPNPNTLGYCIQTFATLQKNVNLLLLLLNIHEPVSYKTLFFYQRRRKLS